MVYEQLVSQETYHWRIPSEVQHVEPGLEGPLPDAKMHDGLRIG